MGGRSTPRLIADTFALYRRYPLLFLVLAAAVIVPYELIVLAATGGFGESGEDFALEFPLLVFYLVVVWPLVSALHIHAVSDVRRADEPRLVPVARRGLAALPVVSAATIMSWLGIFGGLLLLLIPGIVLWIRWFVAAQVAAVEREGWSTALRRSWSLTEGEWAHVLVFLVSTLVLTAAPSFLLGQTLGEPRGDLVAFVAATTLEIIVTSFTALATALLYYDLRTRREALAAEFRPVGPPPPPAPTPADYDFDPRALSDEERPSGWYVDPDAPSHMRYWRANPPGWRGRTRTPRKLRRRWEESDG